MIARQYRWYFLWVALFAGAQIAPDATLWEREKILSGEYWRVFTGHWLHLNLEHFALNFLVGVILVFGLIPYVRPSDITLQLFFLCLLLSLSLLLFVPRLSWYGGLSGVLHGLICLYALKLMFKYKSYWWAGLFALVWFKVAGELLMSGSSFFLSDDLPVVFESHLFGALIGTILAATYILIPKEIFRS